MTASGGVVTCGWFGYYRVGLQATKRACADSRLTSSKRCRLFEYLRELNLSCYRAFNLEALMWPRPRIWLLRVVGDSPV